MPGGPAVTLGEFLQTATRRLRDAGVESPRGDARLLLSIALERDPAFVIAYPDAPLSEETRARVEALIARRAEREPVSRIRGRREFWSLSLKVTADTLDPRPASETLVDAVLQRIGDRNAAIRILDLGTGSGCLLLALLSELPAATGLGVDISDAALDVARENAAALGLAERAQFERRCWGEGLGSGWSIIVSNPPYIGEAEVASLPPEVARYDPLQALTAGPDGLSAYRAIIPAARRLLAPGGLLALEVGAGQAAAVKSLIADGGLTLQASAHDLIGVERCLIAHHRLSAHRS